MLGKEENSRTQKEEFCVEDFIPKDHLLRKIEEAIDFSYIYELERVHITIDKMRKIV